jgi:hypothetical protein
MDRETERQADMTNLIVAFRKFSNAPTKGSRCEINCLISFPVLMYVHIKCLVSITRLTESNQINWILDNLLHVTSTKIATYHR